MARPSRAESGSILIVDDEPDLLGLLRFNLEEAGFEVETALTAGAGLTAAERLHPSLVILDLMLPDLPGTEVCRRIRTEGGRFGDPAILILSARGDEFDRVVGLELGADDYVVKPYSLREVILRAKALVRRNRETQAARKNEDTGGRLRWRGLEVDPIRHRVYVDGAEITLRPVEFKLLATLLAQPGIVFNRDRVLDEVWGISSEVNPRTIDTHVRRLRKRLGSYGEAIETVHGFGYRVREA